MKFTHLFALKATICIIAGCSSGQPPTQASVVPEVPVDTVKTDTATFYTEFPAKLEGGNDVEIRSQVTGKLEKIFVDEGVYVNAGTPLFQIDARSFQEDYNNAQGELLAAKAAVTINKLEVEKVTPLVQSKVISEYQLKSALATLKAATAREIQAQAKARSAYITLGFATIKAPVSGYVGRLSKKTGSLVAPGDSQALTYLSDNRKIRAYFSIGETDFTNLKDGLRGSTISQKLENAQAVTLILSDGSIYEHKGLLDMIDAAFDKNTGAITLRASFPNELGLIRSGNTGKVKIGVKQPSVIAIAQEATFEMQDKIFAFTVNEQSKIQQVPIRVSGSVGNTYYIAEGLKSGDRIVVKGMHSLKDGMKVKTQPKSSVPDIN